MRLTKSIMEHPQWGTIFVTCNPKARRIILRSRPDGIHITTPPLATKKDIERAIDECVPRLMQRQEQRQESIIDRQYRIDGENFVFRIEEHAAHIFQIRYSGKEAVLLCPIGTCYSDMKMQEWLRKAMTTALARRAKELLPGRLRELAAEKGFTYGNCTVRNVHSRWGSCNTKGNISLSIYLALLPNELADYVMLHELCHTVEMNHSDRFWALMDRVVAPARAKDLRKRLKLFRTQI